MEKKLFEWFNKTGYPFELWTEALFSRHGFRVENAHLYQDEEDQRHRELDLVATIGWTSKKHMMDFVLNLLVECKKSDKPFIILRSTKARKHEVSAAQYYTIDDVLMGAVPIISADRRIPLPGKSSYGFKLVQGFVTGDEVPYKASHTLIKSFNDWLRLERQYMDSHIKDNYNTITLPLLVLDAPLFELSTGNDGAIKLQSVDSGVVDHLSHLTRAPHSPFPIPVVHKSSLETYIASLLKYGKAQFNHLVANPKSQIRNAPNIKLEFVVKPKVEARPSAKK